MSAHSEAPVTLTMPRHRGSRWRKAVAQAMVCMAEQEERVTLEVHREALALKRTELRELWIALGEAAGGGAP